MVYQICGMCFLVTQCVKYDDTNFVSRWNAVVSDNLLGTSGTVMK